MELTGGSATFEDANVGEDKTVNGSGFSLSGTDAPNYNLESSDLEQSILQDLQQLLGDRLAALLCFDVICR